LPRDGGVPGGGKTERSQSDALRFRWQTIDAKPFFGLRNPDGE
jgi:hypothetical protein